MGEAFTSKKNGALWIQPDGPNTEPHYLGCHDLGDLSVPEGGMELLRCFKPDGSGWDVVGSTETPPDPIGVTVTSLLFKEREWLEKVRCRFALYVLHRDCGQADVFGNYQRGEILARVRRASRTYAGLVSREEDTSSTLEVELEAEPPLLDVDALEVVRIATTEVLGLNGVDANLESRCYGDCGESLDPGEHVYIGADSAVGPATGNVLLSTNEGVTFAGAGADPFGAGLHIKAIARFPMGRDTVRILAAKEAVGAAQGQVAYSDNGGATWTVVNIGGAAAGHGVSSPHGLFALDSRHIWLASALGYVYFSEDGGETWAVLEAGVISVASYGPIHFADELNGIAGGPADLIVTTSDGGATWAAVTATGGGGDILDVVALDGNRYWIGDDDGKLWFSRNAGTTWTQRTGWTGSGTGDIKALYFVDEYRGFMLHDAAGPLGTVLRTINGGYDWEALDTPLNAGLNDIVAPTGSLAFVTGEAQGGTGVILKVRAA